MHIASPTPFDEAPALQAWLLGVVDYEACLALQQRLVYEASGRDDGQINVLLCEHPPIVTVGRRGSRDHIYFQRRDLASRRLSLRWVNHGGACLPHAPGQLAAYPIVPLAALEMSLGDYLRRLQGALAKTVGELRVTGETRPGQWGVWGRGGQLAALGVAVKSQVAYHGAFLNVSPDMSVFRWVRTDPKNRSPMTSLAAEHGRPVRMSRVRETLLRRLAEALGRERYHIHSGHPLLPQMATYAQRRQARVG